MTDCVFTLPPVLAITSGGVFQMAACLWASWLSLLPFASLLPMPGAMVNVTLARGPFDYTCLRAQWCSHCVVYQLFGQTAACLPCRVKGEGVFPSESGRVYHFPPDVFVRARLSFTPVSRGSLTPLLTVINPLTLRRLLRKEEGPVAGSLRKLQTTLTSLRELEVVPNFEGVAPEWQSTGFDLLTLIVEHMIKTKVVTTRQLLEWSGYPAVVLLPEVGVLPSRSAFHRLYWHTFTARSSSSAGVAVLVGHDSRLHIEDFTHHLEGRAIVLEVTYCYTPIHVVNAYLSTKGTARDFAY